MLENKEEVKFMNVWNPHNYLCHYGVRGQVHGERRYQNLDGTWTELGKARRRIGSGKISSITMDKTMRYGFANGLDNKNDTNGKGNKEYMKAKPFWKISAYASNPSTAKDCNNAIIAQNVMSKEWDGIKTSMPAKKKPTSITDDVENTNPNRDAGLYNENNCGLCSMAYCARRAGLNVQASYAPFGSTYDAYKSWIKDLDEKVDNGRIFAVNKDSKKTGLFKKPKTGSEYIEDHIKATSEPGTCGMFVVHAMGFGHAMNYEHLEDGRVILLNPQDKTVPISRWLDYMSEKCDANKRSMVGWSCPIDAKSFTKEAFETTGKPGEYGYAIEPYLKPNRKQ